MRDDPIVEEVRKAREAYAAKFNYDLDAIVEDLRRLQREGGRTFVSYPPRRPIASTPKRSTDEAA